MGGIKLILRYGASDTFVKIRGSRYERREIDSVNKSHNLMLFCLSGSRIICCFVLFNRVNTVCGSFLLLTHLPFWARMILGFQMVGTKMTIANDAFTIYSNRHLIAFSISQFHMVMGESLTLNSTAEQRRNRYLYVWCLRQVMGRPPYNLYGLKRP